MSDSIDGPIIGPEKHESIALILLEACQKGITVHVSYGDNSMVVRLSKYVRQADGCGNTVSSTYEIGAPTIYETAYEHDALLSGVLRRLVDEMHGVKS